MERNMKYEICQEINRIKRMLSGLETDGELTHKERETIMKHIGAVKAVLYDEGYIDYYSRHRMRFDRIY